MPEIAKTELFVTLVAPLRNDGKTVADFTAAAHALLERSFTNYEIVLIDRDSEDDTVARVERALGEHRCVRLLTLSSDEDEELAMMVGLDSAIGDFIVTMIPGMDPLASIPEMVRLAHLGNDVVLGVDDRLQNGGLIYRAMRGIFYSLAKRIIPGKLIPGATAFRVMSRHAVNALIQLRTRRRHFTPLLAEIGFKPVLFPYKAATLLPEKQMSLVGAVRLGISLIVHNSNLPLRMVSLLGMGGSLLCFLYSIYVVIINFVQSQVVQGWTTLSLQVSGLFMLVFLMLALIGEYLDRVLEQTTERPLYYIHGEKISSVMLTDLQRTNISEKTVDDHHSAK